ncbi:MAG: hypothetical protein B6243_04255 [Anaerolineaceae bacterium 4572_5.2]|nr:MAG: hypothetical protein B6243_04255 [Anaerolineaceae bacterium 4572_5.2]
MNTKDTTHPEIHTELQNWRTNTLNTLLFVATLAMTPALVIVIINTIHAPELRLPTTIIYLIIYLCLTGLTFFRQLDTQLRGWGLVLIAYVAGSVSMAIGGLAGDGRLYLMVAPIAALTLIGLHAGITAGTLSMLIYAVFGIAAQMGWLSEWLIITDNTLNLSEWLLGGFVAGASLTFIITLQWRFNQFLTKTAIEKAKLHKQTQQEIVERMQAEIDLQAAHKELEIRVEARTAELAATNQKLQTEINERVEAEASLRESEERYRGLVENAPTGILSVNSNGQIINVNSQMLILLGSPSAEATMKINFFEFQPLIESGISASIKQVLNTGSPSQAEHQYSTKWGKEIHVMAHYSPIKNNLGETVGVQANVHDISEQVRAKQKIEASLREKEVLLKEIHHRVKNNLAIISSLLSFQAEITPSEEVQAAFQESQNRIMSMARIHEHLYSSRDLASIKMKHYIQGVVDYLRQTYHAYDITFQIETDDVLLDIDKAIPCGLIFNELISNVFKYAFPASYNPDQEKLLQVFMRLDDKEQCKLIVSDNGIGLPPDLDIKNVRQESLGLQLVNILSQQLEGDLQIDLTNGTTFSFTFPCPTERSISNDT